MTHTTVAGRALVRHGDRLLLVTDGGGYWYTPGGRIERGETLPRCVAREVQEETGAEVTVGDLIAVSEFLDPDSGERKVECFFTAEFVDPPGAIESWHDTGGPVRSAGLFGADELAGMIVHPAWVTRTLADLVGGQEPIYLAPDQQPAPRGDLGGGSG